MKKPSVKPRRVALRALTIRLSRAEGAHIRAAAAEAGQSVQRFILDTLRTRIGTPPEDEGTNDTDDNQTTD
ncbi:MAG: hypothetical protein U0J65_02550 [Christensenellales bacterium]|nr:hypothetical protein [Christensenellales bacterium]